MFRNNGNILFANFVVTCIHENTRGYGFKYLQKMITIVLSLFEWGSLQ